MLADTHIYTKVLIVLSTLAMIGLISQFISLYDEVVTDKSFWKYKLALRSIGS